MRKQESKKSISARVDPSLIEQIDCIAREQDKDRSRVIEELLKKGLLYDRPRPILSTNVQDAITVEVIKAIENQFGICIRGLLNTPREGSMSLLAVLAFIAIALAVYLTISAHL